MSVGERKTQKTFVRNRLSLGQNRGGRWERRVKRGFWNKFLKKRQSPVRNPVGGSHRCKNPLEKQTEEEIIIKGDKGVIKGNSEQGVGGKTFEKRS